jgi:hypothetical protein
MSALAEHSTATPSRHDLIHVGPWRATADNLRSPRCSHPLSNRPPTNRRDPR